MRAAGQSGQRDAAGEPDGHEILSRRMWVAMLLALGIHLGLLLWAYLQPPVPMPNRRRVVIMDVVKTPPKPAPKPEPPKPTPPEPEEPKTAPSRPLPSLLQPVPRKGPQEEKSPAIEVPVQPPAPSTPTPEQKGPRGPIQLFPSNLGGTVGPGGPGAVIPKGPNRMLKDERLDVKKEPDFVLVPEKGGGFRYDGKNFNAHIAADGTLTFDDRGPIGVQKGGTFSFDLTDLAMRGHKQDPYAPEKRRFVEFSQKLRDDLHGKGQQTGQDGALLALPGELDEIWTTTKPAAVRRREIFEKWVDVADDKDGAGSSGQKARRMIESYVRKHMPQGTALSYTAEELARFAESRDGLPTFEPYRSR